MRKLILLMVLLIFSMELFSSSQYKLVQFAITSVGGAYHGPTYDNAFISFGQTLQGKQTTQDKIVYVGFLHPNVFETAPVITSINDVPHDQGLQVQVVWERAGLDYEYTEESYYSLWRLDDDFSLNLSNKKEKLIKTSEKTTFSNLIQSDKVNDYIFENPRVLLQKAIEEPNKHYYWLRNNQIWCFITQIPAVTDTVYSYIAPTLSDSSVTNNYTTFKVLFHREIKYFESLPDSGYSVDNIAPDATRGRLTLNGNNIKLQWEKVEYGTYNGNRYLEKNGVWYKIYASDKPDFTCDSSTYVTTVSDLEYDLPISGVRKFFKIVVSDKP